MRFLISNTMIKILVILLVIGMAVYYDEKPSDTQPCSTIENYPGRSAVYECNGGLSTVYLHSTDNRYTTVTASVRSSAWLTAAGDDETENTLLANKLGPAGVIGPGAFMAVANGNGLVYVLSPDNEKVLISVAWNATGH